MLTLYCRNCHNQVEQYGIVAEVIYEHICYFYLNKGKAVEMTGREMRGIICDNPIVDFLERKGFLITTESGIDRYGIKPAGNIVQCEIGKYFCCCEEE